MAALAGNERRSVAGDPAPTPFDVFVLLLTIFSMMNVIIMALLIRQQIVNVVLIVDGVICLVLLADFLHRLHRAPSKRGYFFGELGWLELIGSLPVPGLRFARLPRAIQVGREVRISGLRRLGRSANADRAGSSLLVAVFLTFIVLQFGSMAVLRVEEGADDANILSASDALWWSYVTITTVGYGDRYPVTNAGRNIGVALLTIGVALFGVLTGFLANLFLAPRRTQKHESASEAADLRSQIEELRYLITELREQAVAVEPADADDSRRETIASAATLEGRGDHEHG